MRQRHDLIQLLATAWGNPILYMVILHGYLDMD